MKVGTTVVRGADGRELAVAVADFPDGFPLLVHSGSPGSRRLYGSQVEAAAATGFRLVGYDRPGYGQSPPRPGRTIADGAVDAVTIADALGFERLATWGFSGGGPFALASAALLPDRVVAACVLSSLAPYGALGLDWADAWPQEHQDEVALFFTDRPLARDHFRIEALEMFGPLSDPDRWMSRWGDRAGTDDAHSLPLAEHLAAVFEDSAAQDDQGWWDDWVADLTPWGFDLADIHCPVQLWHGERDAAVPVTHGRWLAEHIPGVDTHILPDDDHSTIETDHQRDALHWLRSVIST